MRKLLFSSVLLAAAACNEPPKAPPPAPPAPAAAPRPTPVEIAPAVLSAFKPLPADMAAPGTTLSPDQIALGRTLFFETRLSKNQDRSCNSCHLLDKYGVDGEPTSGGHRQQRGARNSPTVYNAALQFVQFWDGRAASVEEQAKGPILNPIEMAMPSEKDVLETLNSIPGYVALFKKAFPGDKAPVTYDHVGAAIGAFERTLVTPSRWDKFLAGDRTALTEAEKKGLGKFLETGCVTCHSGVGVGGGMFQKAGLVVPWPNQKDQGRFEVTKAESDRMFFKVPSLRNVAKTAPYFHDGSVTGLTDAVKLMAKHQLGRTLADEDAASIATFLGALTGELPTDVKAPELPKSGPKTPKPNPT